MKIHEMPEPRTPPAAGLGKIGSIPRECLDRVIVFNGSPLGRTLSSLLSREPALLLGAPGCTRFAAGTGAGAGSEWVAVPAEAVGLMDFRYKS